MILETIIFMEVPKGENKLKHTPKILFERRFTKISKPDIETILKALTTMVCEGEEECYMRLGNKVICFKKHGNKGVLVIVEGNKAEVLCEALRKCILPKLDYLVQDKLKLKKCVDRVIMAIIGLEGYLKSTVINEEVIKSLVIADGKRIIIVGKESYMGLGIPRRLRDVILRYENGSYLILIPFRNKILIVKCTRNGISIVCDIIELLKFEYPRVLLQGRHLEAYMKLRELYKRIYEDGIEVLIGEIDKLVEKGYSLEDAISLICKIHGVPFRK